MLVLTGWFFIMMGVHVLQAELSHFMILTQDELSVNSANKLVAQDKALVYCSGGVIQGVGELKRKF